MKKVLTRILSGVVLCALLTTGAAAATLQSGQADRLLAAALADGRMWQVEERGVAALGEDGTFCWRLRAVPEVEAPGLGLSVTAEGGGERFTARADRDGLAYEAELRAKERRVRDALERIGGLENAELRPIMRADQTAGYRNKAQLPLGRSASGELLMGFYALHSHRIVACSSCLLQPPRKPPFWRI